MDKLNKMVEQKNWAVVGARSDESTFGYKIPMRMLEHGYNVYMVNPKLDEIEGHRVYKKLSDIEEKIDVVDVVVNPKVAISVLDEAKAMGIENIFFQPGTYTDETLEYTDKLGLNYVTNCIYKILGAKWLRE